LKSILNALFSNAPWNQIGWVPLNTYPIVVGITYLLTSEVAFSLWFFFWFMKFQMIGRLLHGLCAQCAARCAWSRAEQTVLGFQMIGAYWLRSHRVMDGPRALSAHSQRALGRTAPTPMEREEAPVLIRWHSGALRCRLLS
jgi:hypothetical protein